MHLYAHCAQSDSNGVGVSLETFSLCDCDDHWAEHLETLGGELL
jgi:hypothetical protein